jgi:hypothetical protein
MKPISVVSSNIRTLHWKEEILTVEFNSGQKYAYQNVPRDTFTDIITADSVGKAFIEQVRSQPSKYPFALVN